MLIPNHAVEYERRRRAEGSPAGARGRKYASHGHVRLFFGFSGGILVLNSVVAEIVFPAGIDPLARDLSALLGALILAVPMFLTAARGLTRGNVHMTELAALAVLAALVNGDYRTAGGVAFLLFITGVFEHRTAVGAEAAIEALVKLTPRHARRLRAGVEEEVDGLALLVGDVCRVRPGENFPADGRVRAGISSVNQASITGESLPVDKMEGDSVFAGTQNLTGAIDVEVTRVGSDTTLGRVRELIAQADRSRLPIMRTIDCYAALYTPSVLMVGTLVWLVTRDFNRVISVLVVSCPCAVLLAAPSAAIAAVAAAARLGVLMKDVAYLDVAASVRAIVFDKTGTLTEGNLEVGHLHPAPGVDLADLVQAAASAERHSNHPAARALQRLAVESGLTLAVPSRYREVPGKGVEAELGQDVFRVGRRKWLDECGLDTNEIEPGEQEDRAAGMSLVFVARNQQVLGWIGLRDAVRHGARQAVAELADLGIHECWMVTGDNDTVARRVGTVIGIDRIRPACLPHEKVAVVEKLKKAGYVVAVVGDGVNDAPALAAGDLGIAMGAIGSDVAIHSASIALMNNDLRRVPFLFVLARRTRKVMTWNLLIGAAFIAGGLCLSALGRIGPFAAALLHSTGTLVVIFNSARLVRTGEYLAVTPADTEPSVGVPA